MILQLLICNSVIHSRFILFTDRLAKVSVIWGSYTDMQKCSMVFCSRRNVMLVENGFAFKYQQNTAEIRLFKYTDVSFCWEVRLSRCAGSVALGGLEHKRKSNEWK